MEADREPISNSCCGLAIRLMSLAPPAALLLHTGLRTSSAGALRMGLGAPLSDSGSRYASETSSSSQGAPR